MPPAAAETFCNELFPERCSTELRPNEKAPFHGVLVTPELGAYYHTASRGCDKRISLAVARTSSTAAADRERDRKIAAADLKVSRAEGYREGYDAGYEAGTPAWYAHPVVVTIAAVAATIGVFVVVKKVDRASD